ncbi:MAG: bifunctional precorrin-2 dehydrogenase/sirohydrochlorin ferrochelatase [Candidatus Omnitrophica bacterium]|nr:bifunctional precorrin-2 dehydrogenase/sirohydrochlorin ferrochelatase [Candidatus Omnitrophota bacterium]
MSYYPIFLKLEGRPCLVIGGGQVAAQKAKALAACGAKVTVVSPRSGAGITRLIRRKKVIWRSHRFKPGDLKGAELVVAATDEQAVNELAYRLAVRRGIWINVVDQPVLCSFIVPSVVRRGKLEIAVSTSGVSPALSKWIRKDLEKRYGPEFERLVDAMGKVRRRVMAKVPGVARRKAVFEKALRAYFRVINEGA